MEGRQLVPCPEEKAGVPLDRATGERSFSLPFTRISVLIGHGNISRSSFGGEGQGEEAVVLRQHARHIGGEATGWNVATNRSGEKDDAPPLPNPLLT